MPDELITFLSTLFNVNPATLGPNYHDDDISLDEDLETIDDIDIQYDKTNRPQKLQTVKIMSLFQIMCYNLHCWRMKTPLHVMNAHAIYEKCKSRKFITSFNRTGI